jgi:hypothetical protein
MKKIRLFLFITVAAVSFTSCLKDEDNSYHGMTILYPSTVAALYADQTTDSLKFISYDSFRITSDATWLTVSEKDASGTVPSNSYWFANDSIHMTPNTTGDARYGYITLYNTYKESSAQACYYQTYFLDVIRPTVLKDASNKYYFAQTDSSTIRTDSVAFKVFGNWTLAIAPNDTATWVSFPEGAKLSGTPGTYIVRYKLATNATGADRSMNLRLTSNGVSTDIKITQYKPKK